MEENEVIRDRATALAILRAAVAAENAPRSHQEERQRIARKMKQTRSATRRIQSNVPVSIARLERRVLWTD